MEEEMFVKRSTISRRSPKGPVKCLQAGNQFEKDLNNHSNHLPWLPKFTFWHKSVVFIFPSIFRVIPSSEFWNIKLRTCCWWLGSSNLEGFSLRRVNLLFRVFLWVSGRPVGLGYKGTQGGGAIIGRTHQQKISDPQVKYSFNGLIDIIIY